VIKIDHNINKMEVWRPWDCECNQNNVEEADLVVDNDGDGKNQDKIVTVLLYNVHKGCFLKFGVEVGVGESIVIAPLV
jgi:hypothetical protein